MGITCKPIGKIESVTAKMNYEEDQKKAAMISAQRKKSKENAKKNTKKNVKKKK